MQHARIINIPKTKKLKGRDKTWVLQTQQDTYGQTNKELIQRCTQEGKMPVTGGGDRNLTEKSTNIRTCRYVKCNMNDELWHKDHSGECQNYLFIDLFNHSLIYLYINSFIYRSCFSSGIISVLTVDCVKVRASVLLMELISWPWHDL